VHRHICDGYTDVVDADLTKYFDTIPHGKLMKSLARRIVDRDVLHLIKMWLKVPVEEGDGNGQSRRTGGTSNACGTPQGGVISPLLANIYLNRFLKYWRQTQRGDQFRARIVTYADDFVILSRGCAEEAMEWTRTVMAKLGLQLNERKTSIRNAQRECFDFLGYTFGPHWYVPKKHRYLGASPSKKSVSRVKLKVRELLRPNNVGTWDEVRDSLNRILGGWSTYFSYGTRSRAYQSVNRYVHDCVCHFLRRRQQLPSRGTARFSADVLAGELGILRLKPYSRGVRA
jgi:RNA-directed DNA polymerase